MVRKHLYSQGLVANYYQWRYQGETNSMYQTLQQESEQYQVSTYNATSTGNDQLENFESNDADCEGFQQMILFGSDHQIFHVMRRLQSIC